MLLILLMLWGSAIMGYLLRRWPQAWVGHVLTVAIWVVLFAIGFVLFCKADKLNKSRVQV